MERLKKKITKLFPRLEEMAFRAVEDEILEREVPLSAPTWLRLNRAFK